MPAEHIHHIIKFECQASEDLKWRLFTDVDNIVAVSEQVHLDIHYRPNNLSDEVKKWLNVQKQRICNKYLLQGIIINVPDDSNITSE